MRPLFLFGSLLVAATTVAQTQKASDVADFVSVDTSVFVLDHVRVIDGTGAPAKEALLLNDVIPERNMSGAQGAMSGDVKNAESTKDTTREAQSWSRKPHR
jgi:hypothetical protein